MGNEPGNRAKNTLLEIRMRSEASRRDTWRVDRAETRGELTTPTGVRTCEPSVNQRVL